jgi:hypothetical protein
MCTQGFPKLRDLRAFIEYSEIRDLRNSTFRNLGDAKFRDFGQ